ncbi:MULTISPECIES: hypothetical protein [unclassified Xanthomonas]|uniref:hypothetical protein n=1 Tax=unclassified Xanthomonas TaxID=2643310 RepID=UPI002A7EF966|nr:MULTISPECIES: hypothetical protein [unclassified Xanthomonas]MDY4297507.1 hypothetical protein [Xanthomonas sp. LF02-5]MDY4359301.1 hypothetical protein [Xanthomonas sp. LF04-12]
MIPQNRLSTQPIQSSFVEPVSRRTVPLKDYERGGRALQDGSAGIDVQLWTVEVIGNDVWLSAETVAPFVYFSRPNISEVALAFDQNMVAYIAFVQSGVAWLYWFDTAVNAMVFSSFPGMVTPRLANDEKRLVESNNSDVILAYVSGNNLCFRAQRERFQTEHVLKTAVGGTLVAVGMNRGNRLQFQLFPN